AVSVLNDEALLGLPEDLQETHIGNNARANRITKDRTGTDARQLIDIADENESRAVGDGLGERIRHPDVYHRALVDDDRASVDRTLGVTLEGACLRIELEQTMKRASNFSSRLTHSLRSPPGRRSKTRDDSRALEHAENGLHDRRLTDARSTRDDEERAARG